MSMWKPRWRLVGAGWLAFAVLLAGCGGGFRSNDAVGRLAPPGTEVPLLGNPAGSPPARGPATPTPGSVPVDPGTAVPSAFCRDVSDIQGLIAALLPGATPTSAARTRALLQRLKNDAPAEVRPAVAVLLQVEDRVIADLSATPVNVADLSAAFASPEYQQAIQQVVVYAARHCSIGLTPPGP